MINRKIFIGIVSSFFNFNESHIMSIIKTYVDLNKYPVKISSKEYNSFNFFDIISNISNSIEINPLTNDSVIKLAELDIILFFNREASNLFVVELDYKKYEKKFEFLK